MSDSDGDKGGSQPELRQRFKNESDENEKEIEAVLIDNESCEIISDTIEPTEHIDNEPKPKVTVCRGIRNLQPLQHPSFISRQFNNVKNFFVEFIEFILLL